MTDLNLRKCVPYIIMGISIIPIGILLIPMGRLFVLIYGIWHIADKIICSLEVNKNDL